jgi:hypothetical protein
LQGHKNVGLYSPAGDKNELEKKSTIQEVKKIKKGNKKKK